MVAATLLSLPQLWRNKGTVLVPFGLLVLLAGFILTSLRGIEGRLMLRPGQTAETVLVTDRSNLTLLLNNGEDAQSIELGFSPGPADWRSDQPLDFGEVHGIGIKVLRFYRHAQYGLEWVPDETGQGTPAIQVALSDAAGGGASERWCVPVLFGGPPPAGGPYLSFEQASAASLRESFLQTPSLKPGSRGVLAVHYQDHVYPVAVDGNIGKKLPVGESPLSVEIVEYYANSMSSKGKFSSKGAEPKNPMLRLHVHVPGQKQPIEEIAYAKQPLLNIESIKKQKCPVKFWYYHPAVPAPTGAEFLQTPDGKLYCRVGADGVYQPRGEVKVGDRITLSADRQISLLCYIPHSRLAAVFTPVEFDRGQTNQAEAAALVELTTAGKSEQFWLGRNPFADAEAVAEKLAGKSEQFWLGRNDARDAQIGIRRLQTPGGSLLVLFAYERRPLGFSAKLVEFHRDTAPDSASGASCASQLYLSEERAGLGRHPGDQPAPRGLNGPSEAVRHVYLLSVRLLAVAPSSRLVGPARDE